MGRYKIYDNGLKAHRYRNYYIVKDDEKNIRKSTFTLYDKDKNIVKTNIRDFDDARWEIEKLTASDEDMENIKFWYSIEPYEVNTIMGYLFYERNNNRLSKAGERYFLLLGKVRARIIKGKPF